ncbi:TIGR03621 family F420-dependent LLM class oxidoreductase [Spirillospora sp. CA-255316]
MRPFRFAVQTTTATSAGQWRDLARKVEDLGYSTLFLADHYIGPGPVSDRTFLRPQHLAPIAAMAAAAAWTSTLRVGCRVFCVDYHVPAALAKEAATIDLLSDGRLEFGIGAGTNGGEYAAMGLAFEDAPRRVSKLEEVVALIKAHSTGEQIDHDGAHVKVGGYSGLPLPVQRPHPPIMIGGSRKRVLSLAAREADIVSLANVPWSPVNDAGLTPLQEARRRFRLVRDAAGERFTALEVESSPYVLEVTDAADEALARWAARLRTAVPEVQAESLRDHPNVLVGSLGQIVERLRERRETMGVNYITVPRKQIDDFAPVVAELTGK